MAHKPSGRTHRVKPDTSLNLTPMIDIISNLMFFLMMFMSVIPVVTIDAPLPKVASTADEVRKAKDDSNKLEVVVTITDKGFAVKSDLGSKSFSAPADDKFPYDDLHKFLVEIHNKKPTSREITLMPSDDVPYEVMINVMDASRDLKKDDQGFQQVPPDIAQKPESEQFNRLFPDVSIGGV